MIYDLVHKGHTKLHMFSVFGEPIMSLCSKQSKLNFWNRLHPKIAFVCRFLTQKVTWKQNHTIMTQSENAIRKSMTNTVIWHQVRGGVSVLCYSGRFFQHKRVLWGWLAGPPHVPTITMQWLPYLNGYT